jgi:hypothetical protein
MASALPRSLVASAFRGAKASALEQKKTADMATALNTGIVIFRLYCNRIICFLGGEVNNYRMPKELM